MQLGLCKIQYLATSQAVETNISVLEFAYNYWQNCVVRKPVIGMNLRLKERCSFIATLCVVVQCAFLVYCFAPMHWNGSLTMYNKVIRPFILKHQKKIDETLGKAAGAAKTALDEGFIFVYYCYLAFVNLIRKYTAYSFFCNLCFHVLMTFYI